MARSLAQKFWISDLLDFPAATFEQDDADGGNEAFRDENGPKDGAGVHTGGNRQEVGQRNFQEPEAEEIHNGGRGGVGGGVEGLEDEDAVGIGDVGVGENSQAGNSQRNDERIAGEEMDNRFSEDHEEETDDTEKDHVVKASAPDGSFGALGLLGAKVLADEGGGGVAEAPTRHEDEDKNADGDGVAGEGGGTKDADDAHEADPTSVRDHELQYASERDTQQAKQDSEVEMNLAAQDANALGAAEETIELVEHANATSGECSESRTGDAAIAMRLLWVSNIINLVLDPCLIFGWGPFPKLGVTGAALATFTGRSIGVLYQFYRLLRGTERIRILRSQIHLNFTVLLRLLRVSLTGILQFMIAHTSWIGLVRIVSIFGSAALAGYTIAIRILIFVFMP